MSELLKNETVVRFLIGLVSLIAGALLNRALARRDKENDTVIETRRAIERKLAGLLGPYLLDSARTQNDLNKIRRDWDAAVAEYGVTVNGELLQISAEVSQYLNSVLDFLRGDIDRSILEGMREHANRLTIQRVPSIRQRRA